jgi:hypothetical protein
MTRAVPTAALSMVAASPKAASRRRLAPNVFGLQDLGASRHVLLVNLAHEAAVDEHAARIEHGAHGSIGHHGAARELLSKLFGASCRGGRHSGDIRTCYSVTAGRDIVILPHVNLPRAAAGCLTVLGIPDW